MGFVLKPQANSSAYHIRGIKSRQLSVNIRVLKKDPPKSVCYVLI